MSSHLKKILLLSLSVSNEELADFENTTLPYNKVSNSLINICYFKYRHS